ncbi:fructokinase [Spirochaetia bacterium]|nr:fructokinase [Spirochaetia bacterium]
MFDVVGLGELLIDWTPAGISPTGMRLFEQNPGGAPANVLTCLSNLGLKTAFIGKVGTDMHGNFLGRILSEKNIDISGLLYDDHVFTTLAFVELNPSGERNFSFARKPGADTYLRTEELSKDILTHCSIFHFGSLSLTNEPARSATLSAIDMAKKSGSVISYDPNYRPPLWENEQQAVEQMRSVLPFVDCIKISDEELELVTGENNPSPAVEFLFNQGIKCIVITQGKNGATGFVKQNTDFFLEQIPCPKVKVVDSTGAGDSFWGGFLYQFLQHKVKLEKLTPEQLRTCIIFANATASLCVQKRGGIPAMPALDEVLDFLKEFSI